MNLLRSAAKRAPCLASAPQKTPFPHRTPHSSGGTGWVCVLCLMLVGMISGAVRADWQYEYYEVGTLGGLPNFNTLSPTETGTLGQISLAPRNRDTNFAFRFTTTVSVATAGEYQFSTTSDDGSQLFIDGQLIVNNDGVHGARTVSGSAAMTAGVHSVVVTFFERAGEEVLEVNYAPPGGGFQTIPESGELVGPASPAEVGSWGSVISWPEIAISAATLPDGRILTWSSTETNRFPSSTEFTHASVFDPVTETFVSVDNDFHDMFCAGISTLEDGTIIASGGNPNDTRTSTFDPDTLTWTPRTNMNFNRWYGTNLTTPTNEVFATFAKSAGSASERYNATTNSWVQTPDASMQDMLNEQNAENGQQVVNTASNLQWWSEMSIMPDGRIFHGGPTQTMHVFDASGLGDSVSLGQPIGNRTRMWSNTVAYTAGHALMVGGSDRTSNPATTNSAYVVDLTGPAPTINPTGSTHFARTLANAVTLPTGKVLLIGGNSTGELFSDVGSVFAAETWDPVTGTWDLLSAMQVPRNYHAVALLLKDGRVLSAGGGACGDGCSANHQDGQIFSPPYLFNPDGSLATRPALTDVPAQSTPGGVVNVQAEGDVVKFAMVRLSAVTHNTNTDQRFLPIDFTVNGAGSYSLQMNANANVLLPGNYWLFAVDSNGVPSVGVTINVRRPEQQLDTDPLAYEYYEGDWDALPNFAELDPEEVGGVDTISLAPRNRDIHYGFRYTGTINLASTDTYTFYLRSDDGSKLWIDDELLIDNDGLHGSIELDGSRQLAAGIHDIRVEFFQRKGGAALQLSYSSSSFAKQTVPANALGSPSVATSLGIFSASVDVGVAANQGSGGENSSGYTISGAGDGLQTNGDSLHFLHLSFASDADAIANISSITATSPAAAAGWMIRQDNSDDAASAWIYTQLDGTLEMRWRAEAAGPVTLVNQAVNSAATHLRIRRIGSQTTGQYSSSGPQGPWTTLGTVDLALTSPAILGLAITGGDNTTATAIVTELSLDLSATDSDGDGIADGQDAFPDDPNESEDTDGDGVGDNADQFPTDPTEQADTDADGVGDNADLYPQDADDGAFQSRKSATILLETLGQIERIWNVNPDNDTVTLTDRNGSKIAEIAVGDNPWSIAKAPNSQQIWVANKRDATLSVIDSENLELIRSVSLPPGSQPHGIVFANASNRLYVVLEATGSILQVDTQTDSVIEREDFGGRLRHLAISGDGTQLFATRFITPHLPGEATSTVDVQSQGGELMILDAQSLGLLSTIQLLYGNQSVTESQGPGLPNYLNAPVLSHDGSRAFVPSKQDNIMAGSLRGGAPGALTFDQSVRAITSVVDLISNSEISADRIDHDNSSLATGAVLSPAGDYLFVALESSREVAVVGTNGNFGLMRINVGRAPQGVVLSARGDRLYTHNFMDRSISVVDVSSILANGTPSAVNLAVVDVVESETLSSNLLRGKQFFYDAEDERLARDNYMSCAVCHNEGDSDGRTWDFSQFGEGLRNTISLQGQGGADGGPVHWTGNFDEIQDFEGQIRTFALGNGLMSNAAFNSGSVSEPLGEPKAGLSQPLDDLASYVNSLTTIGRSPFKADADQLSPAAAIGRDAFINQGCGSCHAGDNFSDSSLNNFHDIGSLTTASGGRLGQALEGLDTPRLKGLWLSSPYLHDGSAPSVADAIDAHTNLNVSQENAEQIAAYLAELDDSETATPTVAEWTKVAAYQEDFRGPVSTTGWSYSWNPSNAIGVSSDYVPLLWATWRYDGDGSTSRPEPSEFNWGTVRPNGGHPGLGSNQGAAFDRYVIAGYRVSQPGEYRLANSSAQSSSCAFTNGVDLRVYVDDALAEQTLIPSDGSGVNYDVNLGSLTTGQTIYVAAGPNGRDGCDGYVWDFDIENIPSGPASNLPPSINAPADQTDTEGDSINLFIEANDADGDALSYQISGQPTGLTINNETGLISGSVSEAGSYSTTVIVADGTSTVSVSFDWQVSTNTVSWTTIANYAADFSINAPLSAWSYLWNPGGAIGEATGYTELLPATFYYDSDGQNGLPDASELRFGRLTGNGGHPGRSSTQGPASDRYVIAAYEVNVAGLYRLSGSSANQTGCVFSNGIDLQVLVNDTLQRQVLIDAGGAGVQFNQLLGELNAGDRIYVAAGPNGRDGCDGFNWNYNIDAGE